MHKRKASSSGDDQRQNMKHELQAPKSGSRPIIKMNIVLENSPKIPIRVLLDSGSTVPVLSDSLVSRFAIPKAAREIALAVRDFSGNFVEGAGKFYTYPILLNHGDHWSKESFEISRVDTEVDAILPWWWTLRHPPSNFFSEQLIKFDSEECLRSCTKATAYGLEIEYDENLPMEAKDLEAKIGCFGFVRAFGDQIVYDWSIVRSSDERIASISEPESFEGKSRDEALQLIPEVYHEFLDVFSQNAADKLPPHRSFDHAIDLKEGEEPPWGPIYALSETELKALREYLDNMLRTGKIRPSKSPAGAPILFVPKAHGRGLRLCVDYQGLNRVSILNRYPLPLMNELRDRVEGSKVFSKIDLKSGYNLIRIC